MERIKELIENGQYGLYLKSTLKRKLPKHTLSLILRDLPLDHSGIMMLNDRYLFKYKDSEGNMLPYKLPQEMLVHYRSYSDAR